MSRGPGRPKLPLLDDCGNEIFITEDEYAAAEEIGVSKNLIKDRITKFFWSKEKALLTPHRKVLNAELKKKKQNVPKKIRMVKDEEWLKWEEKAFKNGISKSAFYQRVQKNKLSFEEASSKPIVPHVERARLAAKSRKNNRAKRSAGK